MTAKLAKLLGENDLYGLMLAVTQEWVEKYHPGSAYAAIVVENLDRNVPSVQITVCPCDLDAVPTVAS